MNLSTPAQLLELWEQGRNAAPIKRSLLLLHAIRPNASQEQLLETPIGERDAELLQAYAAMFQATVDAVGRCPDCGVDVETEVDVEALLRMQPESSTSRESRRIRIDRREAVVRAPTIGDVLDCSTKNGHARSELVHRCLTPLGKTRSSVDFDVTAPTVQAAVERQAAELDPLSDVQLSLSCPECGTSWTEPFDIGMFLWEQIERRAERLLHEIHTLAGAYGWSEAEILRLSPTRRRTYLAMVRQ